MCFQLCENRLAKMRRKVVAKNTGICMTEGCRCKAKTRGVCVKCYSTLRVYVNKGKLTWDGAVAAGLCAGQGKAPTASPMLSALSAAEEAGKIKLADSAPVPQLDPDQEPPIVIHEPLPTPPPGYYYKADGTLAAIPQVSMPAPDPTPDGYAAYDPNAKAAADAPHVQKPREETPPEPVDPNDDIEEELYLDDETPEQKARRQAIERRHRREQESRYIEENGIQPPKGGNVVVVPPPKVNMEKNGDIVTGHGAGPAEGLNIPPGIYVQPHDAPAQQTIDGEPLLPGWSLAPDGVNLISPDGRVIDTTPQVPEAGQLPAPVPQAIVLPATNQPPAGAQLIVPSPATGPAPTELGPNAYDAGQATASAAILNQQPDSKTPGIIGAPWETEDDA
jgi:hypothetical protein